MFELDQAIAEWRREMIASGIKTPVPLDELESHLRESVEREMQLGLDAEQAFQKSIENIGSSEKLEQEFTKVRELKRMQTRQVLRHWSAIGGTAFVYSALATVWFIGMRQRTLQITWVDITFALAAIAPMIGLGWVGNSLAKRLPAGNQGLIIATAFAVIFLFAAALRFAWSAITPNNLVHTQIILLWSLSPLPGIGNCLSAWADNSKRRELKISH